MINKYTIKEAAKSKKAMVVYFIIALNLVFATINIVNDSPTHKSSISSSTPVIGSGVSPSSPPSNIPTAEKNKSVNVVEVLADDMRWDDLRYAPNLLKLAKQSIFLANGFSNYPLCCPARASFLSGKLPHNHHVYTVHSPYGYKSFDDRATLATSLHESGYSTGFIGKYLNGYGTDEPLAPKLEAARMGHSVPGEGIQSQYYVPDGWDDWKGAIAGNWCKPACGGAYHYYKYGFSDNGVPTAAKHNEYSSNVIGDQAVDMAKKFTKIRNKNKKPFLMSVNYIAPHFGIDDRAKEKRRLGEEVPATPCKFSSPAAPGWAFKPENIQSISRGAGVMKNGVTEDSVKDKPSSFSTFKNLSSCEQKGLTALTQSRAAAVYALDKNVGKLIRELKSSGEWKRTVFLFWSDNGYFQGEHRRPQGKILAYEPVLRVPMIITGPGMRNNDGKGLFGGEDLYDPVGIPDLTATLIGFAGAGKLPESDGVNKKDVLVNGGEGWKYPVVVEAAGASPQLKGVPLSRDKNFKRERDGIKDPRTSIGLRLPRYTYVRYVNKDWELYDNIRDPFQWNNLAKNEKWKARHVSLIKDLETTWLETKDCKVDGCRPLLPTSLSASNKKNETLTRAWYETIMKTYWSEKEFKEFQ